MDDDETFFDFLEAREVALQAAAGYFAVCNVPSDRLRAIAANEREPTIGLAARVVLWQRGEAV